MNTCPSCGSATIGFLVKWLSKDTHPTACTACGRLSYVPAVASSGIFVSSALLLTLVGWAAIAAHSAVVFVSGALAVFAVYIYRWRRVSLEPISAAHVVPGAKAVAVVTWVSMLSTLFQ